MCKLYLKWMKNSTGLNNMKLRFPTCGNSTAQSYTLKSQLAQFDTLFLTHQVLLQRQAVKKCAIDISARNTQQATWWLVIFAVADLITFGEWPFSRHSAEFIIHTKVGNYSNPIMQEKLSALTWRLSPKAYECQVIKSKLPKWEPQTFAIIQSAMKGLKYPPTALETFLKQETCKAT